jgi:anaerobic selenocysteine-containing dehydrogenase/Fe-S-cluster-containing dehydrogenase component
MPDGLSRRSFIKLAATAGAAAALPGCEPAARKLIPYVVPDENVIPGVPTYYATVCNECPAGCGVVAKVREGRVIKLEGNPADPISQGALCARGQAALQGLYNPDRLAHPQVRSQSGPPKPASWDDALKLLNDRAAAAAKAGRDRVAFIGSPPGPTLRKIVLAWLSAYQSQRAIFYEPIGHEPARAAAMTLFGRRDLPAYHIDQAEVLISFGADFIETWQSPVELARQYAEFRAPRERRGALTIGRSFYVGPRMSLTASKCDELIAVRPGAEAEIAWSVLLTMIRQRWVSQNSGIDLAALSTALSDYDPLAVSARTGVPVDTIMNLADTFGRADGALALAGTDDPAAHLGAFALNAVTGNVGRTMVFLEGAQEEAASTPDAVAAAVGDLRDGKVDVLVIAGANPVFTMPPEWRIAEALQRVATVVWCGGVPDETAQMANLLLPAHHPLESWRDTAPRAGLNGLGQPVMQPVFASRALGDILLDSARASGANIAWKDTADAVKATWQDLAPKAPAAPQAPAAKASPAAAAQPAPGAPKPPAAPPTEDFWTKARRDGGWFENRAPAAVKANLAALNPPTYGRAVPELQVAAFAHIFLYDGRGADKPWLQEIPEPVGQILWDSWAEIHPLTAAKLRVSPDELIELRTEHGTIEAPAYVSPRIHPGVIAVPLGQGHTSYGRWARNRGANPWAVLPAGALSATVTARATGRKRRLVSPLGKGELMGRTMVEAMSIEELARGTAPPAEALAPGPYEMYEPWKYPKHQWGMTIDVNACTGCSACVAACYAENNLPVVGKEEVDRGRIMSWIRIERYFPSEKEETQAPLLYLTPMLCQQCDHAPCEPVCPVFAAVHTEEGLNGQIYNRCVGTRYCENNCPYKVRRFNWFAPEWPAPLNLQLNPDVTVRGAGVMEKCTFCIQRIQYAEITARTEDRALRDGEIVPACAQACPARAITFGDMKDSASAMMQRRTGNQARSYTALRELNTLPAIEYLRELYREKGKA